MKTSPAQNRPEEPSVAGEAQAALKAWVDDWMTVTGMSQRSAAMALRLIPTTLRRYLDGSRPMPPRLIVRLPPIPARTPPEAP